jgi:ATP-binding cassette subfamily B protein
VVEATLLVPVPWLVARAIDRALPQHERGMLVALSLAVLAATVASVLIGLAARAALLTVTRDGTARLRRLCTACLIGASRQFHTDAEEGALHDVLVTNAARVDEMVATVLGDVIPGIFTILALALALLVVNPLLTLITAVLAPLLVATHGAFRPARATAVRRFHDAYERFAAGVLRVLRADELIRVQGAHDAAQHDQEQLIADLEISGRRARLLDFAHDGAQLTGVSLVATAILLIGGLLVIDGRLEVGGLISFYAAFGLLRRPITQIATATGLVNAGSVALGEIDRFLATVDTEPYHGHEIIERIEALELRDVTFAYPGRVSVVHDLSLCLPRGRVVGLAGPNGSGKSTIVHLLLGLYRPERGVVVVNGRPYDAVDVVALRTRVGVVPQHPVFLSGTIEENLRAGSDRADLAWALATAGADTVVALLPDGLHTRIGDDGVRLSGGQRQRLAIARALARHPQVLVLDEPTLHLDAASVARVLELLRSADAPAVLLVSHQADVLATADEVIDVGNHPHSRLAAADVGAAPESAHQSGRGDGPAVR